VSVEFEDRGDRVALIRLNRPEVRNALDPESIAELAKAWRALDADDALRVGVITGAGTAFCAGADLKKTVSRAMSPEEQALVDEALLLGQLPDKPIVAAVNGACVGAGCVLALRTDLRVAAAAATFSLVGIRLNVYAAGAGSRLSSQLTSQVSYGLAARMLLRGDRVGADEALAAGLVSEVAPDALESALVAAAEIASYEQEAVRSTLAVLRSARAPSGA
jgi:enoyl-CoA hydratase/carnithine racemase